MNTPLSIISDIMLWISLPLFGLLGYWEENLTLIEIDRKFVQFFLVVAIIVWITFWYSTGENERLTHYKSKPGFMPFNNPYSDYAESINTEPSKVNSRSQKENFDQFEETDQEVYSRVSNH